MRIAEVGGLPGFLPWPRVKITPAIKWVEGSDLKWYGSDRGAEQDLYETQITYYDKNDDNEMAFLQQILYERKSLATVSLDQFELPGQDIFGPEVDYSEGLSVTITDYDRLKISGNNRMGKFGISMRANGLPQIGTEPSLDSLRLTGDWEGDFTWNHSLNFSQSGVPTKYLKSDRGMFKGKFVQTNDEIKEILAYLLTEARNNEVALPEVTDRMFGLGYSTDSSDFCVIREIELQRKNLSTWLLSLTIHEALLA